DQTLVREAGEELFDDPRSPRIRLAASAEEFASRLRSADLAHEVVMRRVAFQKGLRDVRAGPGGAMRNVLYHVAIYAGRTDLPATAVRETEEEIGVDLSREADYLGPLDEVHAMARLRPVDLAIAPFAFRLRGAVTFRPNHEVRSIHWIPLDELMREDRRSVMDYS